MRDISSNQNIASSNLVRRSKLDLYWKKNLYDYSYLLGFPEMFPKPVFIETKKGRQNHDKKSKENIAICSDSNSSLFDCVSFRIIPYQDTD